MTIQEASEKYNIPIKILREYEHWGLCGEVKKVMGSWHYDNSDIERLSTIMTLHDIGFTNGEIEKYMRMLLKGKFTEKERLKMLNDKRLGTLDEIHFKESVKGAPHARCRSPPERSYQYLHLQNARLSD